MSKKSSARHEHVAAAEPKADPEPMAIVVAMWRERGTGGGWRSVTMELPARVLLESGAKPCEPEIRAVVQGRALKAIERFET